MAQRQINTALEAQDKPADLPSLFERLADDVAKLFDQKLTLLKIELKEETDAYIRGIIAIAAGAIVAAVGFSLANIALAFAVSTLFQNTNLSQPGKYGLAFVITGVAYLVIGAAVILIAKNRLAKQGIIPRRTVRELERDKQWLEKEI